MPKTADFSKCPACGGLRAGPKLIIVPEAKGEGYCRSAFHPCNKPFKAKRK